MMAGNSGVTTKVPKYAAGTQPFTVLIEGNIGSGKTTFLNHFQQFQEKICLITEPVEKWRNVRGVNLLVSTGIYVCILVCTSQIYSIL